MEIKCSRVIWELARCGTKTINVGAELLEIHKLAFQMDHVMYVNQRSKVCFSNKLFELAWRIHDLFAI